MDVRLDFTDVLTLAAQIDGVAGELPKGTNKAVEVAAYTAKEAWREELNGSEFPAAGASIEYETAGESASIGNTQGTPRMQGFVHAAEYGSPSAGGPRGYAQTAVQLAGKDLERGLTIAGTRAIERALRS